VGLDKITIKHSIPITGSGSGQRVGTNSSNRKKSYQLCPWSNHRESPLRSSEDI
jgi:hypothetical protein